MAFNIIIINKSLSNQMFNLFTRQD